MRRPMQFGLGLRLWMLRPRYRRHRHLLLADRFLPQPLHAGRERMPGGHGLLSRRDVRDDERWLLRRKLHGEYGLHERLLRSTQQFQRERVFGAAVLRAARPLKGEPAYAPRRRAFVGREGTPSRARRRACSSPAKRATTSNRPAAVAPSRALASAVSTGS